MNESVYSLNGMVTFLNKNNHHEFEMVLHSILMVKKQTFIINQVIDYYSHS